MYRILFWTSCPDCMHEIYVSFDDLDAKIKELLYNPYVVYFCYDYLGN